MESAYCSAGYYNKEHRDEHILACIGFIVAEGICCKFHHCYFSGKALNQQGASNCQCHKEQYCTHIWVYCTNNFIYREKSGNYIVDENYYKPNLYVPSRHLLQQSCRAADERCSNSKQQCNYYKCEEFLEPFSKVFSNHLIVAGTIVPEREHTCHVIVCGTHKDTSQNNPQICYRSVSRTHNGAENWPQPRNVEELYDENLPRLQYLVIHTVRHLYGRNAPLWICPKKLVYKLAVCKIPGNKDRN